MTNAEKPPRKKRKKSGGRRKGTPNKLSSDVKSMVLGALSKKGGQKYLEIQAELNPVAFMTLLGKILPTQITGKDDGPIRHQHALSAAAAKAVARELKNDC